MTVGTGHVDEHFNEDYEVFKKLKDKEKKRFPEFFVISPPKTGTTWLFHQLQKHPDIYIPEVKEVKYFSDYWKYEDINWYLKHYRNSQSRKSGDISPTYSILPTTIIKILKNIKPDLKLIFLMRDPVNRAWSNAKHAYKY